MLTYDLTNNDKPIYEMLYDYIKLDIINKNLKSDKLPSKRKLANHLNISLTTVQNAYEQLVCEGYIYSIPKKGYYINKQFNSICNKQKKLSKNTALKKENTNNTNILYDLRTSNVATEIFPFSIWLKLRRQVVSTLDKKLLVKSESIGIPELRHSICEHLYSFRGLNVDPNQVIIGAGTEYLYNLLIQLLGRNNTFAIEDPGYNKLEKIYKSNDVKIDYIPIDVEGIELEKLYKKNINILHISPNHHFPLGITMSKQKRIELLNWANRNDDKYIIEDDYDSEFTFSGKPIPTLQSIDDNEKVIYMNTFSKTIAPSMRISYMILPKKLMEKYNKALNFYSSTVSTFDQYTLSKFISDGYYEKHLNRLKNNFRNKRDCLITALNKSKSKNKYKIFGEHSGLNFIIEINTTIDDATLVEKAKKQGLYISCLSEYYLHNKNVKNHCAVINYTQIKEIQSKKIATIFDKILK